LSSNSLEIMLHRRLVADDARGVGEALNETVCALSAGNTFYNGAGEPCLGLTVSSRLRVALSPSESAARVLRSNVDLLNFKLEPLLSKPSDAAKAEQRSVLAQDAKVAENVVVLHAQTVEGHRCGPAHMGDKDECALVRVAHQYELDEDPTLSQPSGIDFGSLFSDFRVKAAVEVTMSGAESWQVASRKRLPWKTAHGDVVIEPAHSDDRMLKKSLLPFEIRTFLVVLSHSKEAQQPTEVVV